MEILIPFLGVGIPLILLGLYADYKSRQEERKEKNLQNS
jgi:hypothetical protein